MTTLELHLISAKNLQYLFFENTVDVYAAVRLIDGKNGQRKTTAVFRNCDTNPTFNCTIPFTVDSASVLNNSLSSLEITLLRNPPFFWPIAGSTVLLKDLLEDHNGMECITSTRLFGLGDGDPHCGELSFSYKFGDTDVDVPAKEVQPVASYPNKVGVEHNPVKMFKIVTLIWLVWAVVYRFFL